MPRADDREGNVGSRMRRWTTAGVVAALAVPAALPAAAAAPPPRSGPVVMDFPRDGCASIVDPEGDANPDFGVPGLQPGNEPDLDIVRVCFKTTETALAAYVEVDDLAETPGFFLASGHRFSVGFTHAGKAVVLSAEGPDATSGSVAGATSADVTPTAVFDDAESTVVLSVPRAGLERATGAPLPDGTLLTETLARTELLTPGPTGRADTAQAAEAADRVYAVGDLTCFLPPPPVLQLQASPRVQHGDLVSGLLVMTNAADEALPARQVSLALGGGTAQTVTTGPDGRVRFWLPAAVVAGEARLEAGYPGDDAVGPANAQVPVTVVEEATRLRASARAGTVTATLVDDDGSPLRSHPVLFQAGRTRTTIRTDARGVARLTRVPSGTAVTVSYEGVPGRFAAAAAVRVRA